MVRASVGAGRLPLSLVSRDLAAGDLVHRGDVDAPEVALWALYPSRRLLSARVSAFLDYLEEAFLKGTPDELATCIAGDSQVLNSTSKAGCASAARSA